MPRLVTLIPLLCALFTSTAQAEGLVQITIEGKITREGGARVELDLGAWHPAHQEAREMSVSLFLAEHTTAADVATLFATRISDAGFTVIAPTPTNTEDVKRAQLFVERAVLVSLRLGSGLSGAITACDSVPVSVRVLRPELQSEEAQVSVTISTFNQHSEKYGQEELSMAVPEKMNTTEIAGELFKLSLQSEWIAERPGTDAWRPMKMADGAIIRGFTARVASRGDWKLEVRLAQ